MKIENADSAVATVTGLEVGTYEFTLTVTDERKLQSSDTVTVVVREGERRRTTFRANDIMLASASSLSLSDHH